MTCVPNCERGEEAVDPEATEIMELFKCRKENVMAKNPSNLEKCVQLPLKKKFSEPWLLSFVWFTKNIYLGVPFPIHRSD